MVQRPCVASCMVPTTQPFLVSALQRLCNSRSIHGPAISVAVTAGCFPPVPCARVSCRFGHVPGVLLFLLTLARSSAEYAYRDGEDRVSRRHVNAAIKQLGNRYLAGLGNTQKRLLRSLIEDGEFPIENSTARELLVSRQVLEYFKGGVDYFAVHPALAKV